MKHYDIAIIGGGAAGLAAAMTGTARGRQVIVLDMGPTPARKVMASGGGRCNFTNMAAGPDKYFGKNPNFVRGALARVSVTDILSWVTHHGLHYVEKTPGQYFCTTGAADIVRALCNDAANAKIMTNTNVTDVQKNGDTFRITSDNGEIYANSIIIATGGISFATHGVSDIGYKIAKKFGHKIIPPRPALCSVDTNVFPTNWAGISIPVEINVGNRNIVGDMLFTHFGIGGPAVYSASVAGNNNDITINILPGADVYNWLREMKHEHGRKNLATILGMRLPAQIARHFANDTKNIADIRDTDLKNIAQNLSHICIPAGTWHHHGMAAAEVTFGGIDTADISSKTMESKLCPGMFFAGEVIDITGDLGGYNLQWAWASGRVAGTNA
ncbi:aminoacetone oxidase family FAD-binding enzyme [bacterium]|nr:aminoacetone oxidase family FAD-binding enzyme [bacterium]